MGGLAERLSDRVAALRERRPALDHTVRTFGYYEERNGNAHAGAVTFYAFLSFFPLLALAFWAVGYLSAVAPDIRREVVDAVESVLPGLVGTGDGQISLATFEEYAGRVGLVGLLALLYTGLGWVAAMRRALATMFQVPEEEQGLGFVKSRVRDLVALVVLGVVLVVSVSLSGAMTWFSESILHAIGLDDLWLAEPLLWLVTHGLAISATTVLFIALYELVPKPGVARRALWQGALAGGVGFELLKMLAGALIAMITQRPAFQAFGVSLVLLVWINYFSRLVMLSTAWAYTAPAAEALRDLEQQPLVDDDGKESLVPAPAAVVGEEPEAPAADGWSRQRAERVGAWSTLGAGAVAALTWLARRRRS